MKKISVKTAGYILFLVLGLNPCTAGELKDSMALKEVQIGGKWFILEIAGTAEQRSRGLMERKSLAANKGMLFDYPYEGNYRIWMKNTLIPLLVLWIDKDATIQAKKILYPCGSGDCLSFGIPEKSRYVIELNADVSGIEEGMTVFGLN